MAPVSPLIQQRWSLDSINWRAIRRNASVEPDALFYLVAAASFMESTTDRYTRNLIDQFSGDDEITSWLERHWLPEELQHGHALRRYVQIAWPNFEWDRVYASFLGEFSAYCCADGLEPTRTREMASRCVVETGTASYYTTLSRISHDPVLATISRRIAEDEIRHYKHFYRYFCRYQQAEPANRHAVFCALWNRLRMIDGQDSVIAMKHLYRVYHPSAPLDNCIYRNLRRRSRQLIRPHFPYRMCVQMLLKPLGLGPRVGRIVIPITETIARRIVP
jgi:Fatty acid desaturase